MKYYPELRIKLKTLAAEAGIIRHEVERARNPLRASYMTEHRRSQVRCHARVSNLAYGMLRGLDYVDMEQGAKTEPSWLHVRNIALKFGKIGETGWDQVDLRTTQLLVGEIDDWIALARVSWASMNETKQRQIQDKLVARDARRAALANETAYERDRRRQQKREEWKAKQLAAVQQPELTPAD